MISNIVTALLGTITGALIGAVALVFKGAIISGIGALFGAWGFLSAYLVCIVIGACIGALAGLVMSIYIMITGD